MGQRHFGFAELRQFRFALTALLQGRKDISTDTVIGSPQGIILDPDNLYHRYFIPVISRSGIHKIRLHDLRHTFGSLLIQQGASIVYVKEQMGHSSIQLTVDTYGHLVPGADVSFVGRPEFENISENRTASATECNPRATERGGERSGSNARC